MNLSIEEEINRIAEIRMQILTNYGYSTLEKIENKHRNLHYSKRLNMFENELRNLENYFNDMKIK